MVGVCEWTVRFLLPGKLHFIYLTCGICNYMWESKGTFAGIDRFVLCEKYGLQACVFAYIYKWIKMWFKGIRKMFFICQLEQIAIEMEVLKSCFKWEICCTCIIVRKDILFVFPVADWVNAIILFSRRFEWSLILPFKERITIKSRCMDIIWTYLT